MKHEERRCDGTQLQNLPRIIAKKKLVEIVLKNYFQIMAQRQKPHITHYLLQSLCIMCNVSNQNAKYKSLTSFLYFMIFAFVFCFCFSLFKHIHSNVCAPFIFSFRFIRFRVQYVLARLLDQRMFDRQLFDLDGPMPFTCVNNADCRYIHFAVQPSMAERNVQYRKIKILQKLNIFKEAGKTAKSIECRTLHQ